MCYKTVQTSRCLRSKVFIRTHLYKFSGKTTIFIKSHLSLDIVFIIGFQNELKVRAGLQTSQLVSLQQLLHLGEVLAELNA